MKNYKITVFLIVGLLIFSNNLNIFANSIDTFISANSSGKIDASNLSIISSNETGDVISKLADISSLYRISFKGENSYEIGQYAKIIYSNPEKTIIPVYSQPENNSNIIGQISVGSGILINGDQGNFVKILYNDSVGYIEKNFVQTTAISNKDDYLISKWEDNQKPKSKYAKITLEVGTALKEDTSIYSKDLAKIPFGAYAILLEIQQDWLKIKTDDEKIGYIDAKSAIILDTINKQKTELNETNILGQDIVNFAKKYLGKPYVYGGTNLETGTDCSGFTYSIFKHFGIEINRISKDQYLNGTFVDKASLLPGDLVFFNTGGNSIISHVGIYIGKDQYIHCTDTKDQGVIISSLNTEYALKTYYGAKRVLK